MGYVSNQPQIVESAKNAYANNPTIVNNIPKDGKRYSNTLANFAAIDNGLAQAQEAIGSSSNVAQIAQTYMYSFPNEQKYVNYVCILSVLAQCAIDNAKRTFDVDINSEISRIQKDMGTKTNGFPIFWKKIQDGKRVKSGSKLFDADKINKALICPMNYLDGMYIPSARKSSSTLPMDYFFSPQPLKADRRQNKKVEEIIEKYSLMLKDGIDDETEDLIFMENYEQMLNEIQRVYISNDYIGLTSWLIDRAFMITPNSKMGAPHSTNITNKNKSLLLKILYDINPNNVVKCFSKNLENA